MITDKVAELLLKIDAVAFRFDPPYTFTSGLKSPIYLDNRLVMSYPSVRKKIIGYYIEAIKKDIGLENTEYLSGTATAAIPHAAFLADKLNLPMIYVRGSAKKHGKKTQIEGFLEKGSKVLVVEDHISTGKSAIINAKAVRSEGGIVKYCVATTNYETEKAKVNFRKNNIKLIYLTTGKEIVKQAYKKKLLTKDEKNSIYKWFANPKNWKAFVP